MQHDRATPDILVPAQGPLLGAHLSDVCATQSTIGPSVAATLDAVASGREATTMLVLRTRHAPVEAVVSIRPMCGADGDLSALVILRLPPTGGEHFVDPALMRHALLDDTLRQIGTTLDLDQMAQGLINVMVPHFASAASLLVPDNLLTAEPPLSREISGSSPLRRVAATSDSPHTGWEAAFPVGEVMRYPPGSPQSDCLDQGKPILLGTIPASKAAEAAEQWRRVPMATLLAGGSMLVLPLTAGSVALGLIICVRWAGLRPFDTYDVEIGMEFASRAALFLDTAQRYNQERTTALTLQRSLLPTGLSAPSSVQVGHRYLPGSQLMEVGGDWHESIALPGARAALVVGDVAGHGVHAAVAMGRLRTAIQTLAALELSPAEALQQLDELMEAMGDPNAYFATCLYASYDAVSGSCEVASAGHPPPLLVTPDGTSRFLDVVPSPPLGVGNGLAHRSRVLDIEDGSLLILYTDGLVESRDSDIDNGLARLRATFASDPDRGSRSVDELCDMALASAYGEQQRDDIAVLIARLHRIDPGQHVRWELPRELTSVHRARGLVGEPLRRWGLSGLVPTTELVVSELVTNAILHTEGPVTLRLIHEEAVGEQSLVCEVHDSSHALPRLHHAGQDEEWGRGLQIVSQVSHRWGARRTARGKVVWARQQSPRSLSVPQAWRDATPASPGQVCPGPGHRSGAALIR